MHFKINIIIILGVITFFGSNSCSLVGVDPNDIELMDMRINHHKQTAVGVSPQMVYLVQEGDEIGGENWTYFYDEIEDFNYESGFIYDLKVRRFKLENPPQDGSAYRYILKSVTSKESVGDNESFDIKLKWAGNNFVHNLENEFSIMEEYSIDCAELCEDLSSDLENKEEVTGTFTHLGANKLKLISIQ